MKQDYTIPIIGRILAAPNWVLLSVLMLFILFSYSNTFYSPFVLDDGHSFITEPKVFFEEFSFTNLAQLGATKFGLARFLPMLSFAIDHKISKGATIVPYHITNISIHLLATIALFFFLRGLLQTHVGKRALSFIKPSLFALFVCGLWALNPVQTNAVTYIVQRMASMAALFYLAALAFYIYGRATSSIRKRLVYFFLFVAASVGAFLSKENSITLPMAVLLVECMFISPDLCRRLARKVKWYHLVGGVILFIILLPLLEHRWQLTVAGYDIRHFNMLERFLTEARVLVFYLSLLALPLPGRMNLEHDFPLSYSLFDPPSTAISILFLGLLVWAAFRYRKKYPLVSFGVFWFFLNLIIESTIVPLELVFEHRLYLPSVGFFLVIMAIADTFLTRLKERNPQIELDQILFLVMVIVLSFSSVLTTLRNNDWRDILSIYQDCVNKSPQKPRVYLNLGLELARQERYDEGLLMLEESIDLGQPRYEEYFKAANNIVVALVERGNNDEAIRRGEEYYAKAPPNIRSGALIKYMYNLGAAYYNSGLYSEAMKKYVTGFVYTKEAKKRDIVNMMMKTLLAAYDDPISRERLHLPERDEDKQGAMLIRMAGLMLDLRDYELANKYIMDLKYLYPGDETVLEFERRHLKETEKNNDQILNSDLHNHKIYGSDIRYRLSLDAVEFIFKYYSPLSGGAEWLLKKTQERLSASDPFISLNLIEFYINRGEAGLFEHELDKALQEFPDFVPLLDIAGSYYQLIGSMEKAGEVAEHILALYPGHRKWYSYKKIISES